jgi:hypothetical protein
LESRIYPDESRCIRILIYPDISQYIPDVSRYIPDVSGYIQMYPDISRMYLDVSRYIPDISKYIPDVSGYIRIYLHLDESGFIWMYLGFQGWWVEENKLCYGVFCYLSKAFDILNNEILIKQERERY